MSTWNSELHHGFRLGDWLIRPDQCVIEGETGKLHLEPKVMEVLLYLADRHGEVVRREELIDEVWRTVVNDEVLSRAISLLRSQLGDDARSPRYIQTVPKAGYRLIAEPLVLEKPPVGQASPQVSGPIAEGAPKRLFGLTRRNAAIIALVALVSILLLTPRDDPYQERIPGGHADLWDWFEAIIQGESDPSKITSVAVLPFDDISEGGDHGYLGDGITDELILALSNAPGLKVVARRSILDLPEGIKDIRRIGQHFGVDVILEGTVKRYEDRLRITAQLGSTEDGFVRWSQTYDEPLGDIFSMQRNVAAVITRELHGYSGIETPVPVQQKSAPSLGAYQLFLNGRYLIKLRGTAPLKESIRMFEQALSSDPEFSRARLALARATVLLPFYDNTVTEDAMYDRALSMLDAMALTGARERGEAESIRAFVANRRWQWIEAEQFHTSALALNPSDSNGYQWYSQHLACVGRLDDAVKASQQAWELDNVSAVNNARLAVVHMWVDDDVAAAEQFGLSLEHGYSSDAALGYLLFLHRQQRWTEMRRLMELMLEHSGYDPHWIEPMFGYFNSGSSLSAAIDAVLTAISELNVPPRMELPIWMLLNEDDRAYATIEKYQDQKRYLDIEFLFASESSVLRESRQFNDLTAELGLNDYWTRYGPADDLD